jgi:lon-related putative ATP-dependent protease
MKSLVERGQQGVRAAFESEEYTAKRDATTKTFQQQKDGIIERVKDQAQKAGFLIQASPAGIMTIPLKKGRALSEQEFLGLSQQEKDALSQRQKAVESEIGATFKEMRNIEKKADEELRQLDQKVGLYAVSHLLEDVRKKYEDLPEVLNYLKEVQEDILNNLPLLRAKPQGQPSLPFLVQGAKELVLRRYAVNVLVDNSALKGAPVITETNPTYNNLFGKIENEAQFGALVTDFTLIRLGALHRANGGYLVLPVEEVLRNSFSWDGLKRVLKNQKIIIEDAGERMGFLTTKTLQPEPIPLDLKVILIGEPMMFNVLQTYDPDFDELFKVKADFDSVMDRKDESVRDYTFFISMVCSEEGLKHFDNSALARVVDHGSRLCEDQSKLSTRFGVIADIAREAGHYAIEENSPYVTVAHVAKAIEEKVYRSSLIQEKIKEMTQRGTLMIDVQGEKVGQLNGLSVIDLGDITFGHPTRITASIGVGREGLIDIEREAKLGGPTHTKGVLILSGYLMEKYAQDKPLSLSARIVFEQSYSGVEGDSASSTELYAILSNLSGLPIKQSIAVTGSVNQRGEVQAIGGVNEKIEGFFGVCKAKGLIGNQGVLIPASNEQNLMLKEEVVEAVREGKFHIWAVKTIDEGIEILTGVKAGLRKEDGTFEEGTVNERVDKRLRELTQTLLKFGKGEDEEEKKKTI